MRDRDSELEFFRRIIQSQFNLPDAIFAVHELSGEVPISLGYPQPRAPSEASDKL